MKMTATKANGRHGENHINMKMGKAGGGINGGHGRRSGAVHGMKMRHAELPYTAPACHRVKVAMTGWLPSHTVAAPACEKPLWL